MQSCRFCGIIRNGDCDTNAGSGVSFTQGTGGITVWLSQIWTGIEVVMMERTRNTEVILVVLVFKTL